MGLTLADIDKKYYATQVAHGKTHEEIISSVPEGRRYDFERNIYLTFTEAHFGLKPKTFWVMLGAVIVLCVILGISCG